MGLPSYANAAELRAAASIDTTPDADRAIVRALDAASREVEKLCRGRKFYPRTETRVLDWHDPGGQNINNRKLWLNAQDVNELAQDPTSVAINGTAVTGVTAGPEFDGPPYQWLELDYGTSTTFSTGDSSHQNVVSVAGVFGFLNEVSAGATTAAISTTTETSVSVNGAAARIDAGDAIRIGNEWMLVQGRAWADTGENLLAALTSDSEDTTIAVADGTTYTIGEDLLIGTERFLIVDIAGNNLVVRRRQNATRLAAHSIGADIYARRTLTVERGQLGPAATTHSTAAGILVHLAPAQIRTLTLAEAMSILAQEAGGWARTIGGGEAEREARGKGLGDLRTQVRKDWAIKGLVYSSGVR